MLYDTILLYQGKKNFANVKLNKHIWMLTYHKI